MITKKYHTLIDIMNTTNASLATYAIILTLLYTIGEPQYTILSFLLFFVPFISYYLERHAKHVVSFLFIHIVLGVILFLLPKPLSVKIIYAAYTTIVMLYHFSKRLKEEANAQTNVSYIWPFLLIGILLYAKWRGFSQLSYTIFVITLVCTILFFITMYLLNFTNFFHNVTVNVDIDFPRIKSINHMFIVVFIGITSCIMIVSSKIPSSSFLEIVKDFILYWLRRLLSFIKPSNEVHTKDVLPESSPRTDLSSLIVADEPSKFWLFLQELLYKFFVLVTVIVLMVLLIYGIYKLYKHFHQDKTEHLEKKEFITPFFKETKVKSIQNIQKDKLHFFLTNNEKIRRYFYREIKKKYKDKVPVNLTADELLNRSVESIDLLISEEPERLDPQLLLLYHKARYSDARCTKEDVTLVRAIIKRK